MDKKVLIISSSPRKGGNSETLAAAFAKGAREAGNPVETVYLREKQVWLLQGLSCLPESLHCVIQDDAVKLPPKCTMQMCWCSQRLSTITASAVSSRRCWIVPTRCLIRTHAFTKAYLLCSGGRERTGTFAGTEKAVQGWVDCFPRCALVGTVFCAGGVNGVGEIAGHPALEQAYQMGKEV